MTLPSAKYRPLYAKFAAQRMIDPRKIEAVVMTESSGNPMAKRDEWRRDKGGKMYLWDTSRGLMQLLESTVVGLGWPSHESYDRLYDPEVNLFYGTKLLAQLIDGLNKTPKPRKDGAYTALEVPFPREVRAALARYNGGGRGNPGENGTLRNESYVVKVETWFRKVESDIRGEEG